MPAKTDEEVRCPPLLLLPPSLICENVSSSGGGGGGGGAMIPPATTTAAAAPGTTAATTEVLRPSKVEGKEGDGRSSPSSSSFCFPPSPLVFFFGRSTQSASFFLSLTPFFFEGGEGGECGICRGRRRRRSLTRLSSSPLPLPGRPTAFIIMLASPFSSGADFPLPLPPSNKEERHLYPPPLVPRMGQQAQR